MKELNKKENGLIKDLAFGYSIYTTFLIFSYLMGMVEMKLVNFLSLLTFIWAGNLLYYIIATTKINDKLNKPDMFIPLLVWSIFCIIFPTYFMTSTLRSIFLMNYFLVVIFGVFRLNLKQFVSLTIFAVLLLGFVLVFIVKNKPATQVDIYNELLLWGMFSLTAFSFAVICSNISTLRQKLKEQKLEILNAFSDIHKLSITDELTGIYNRRYIMDFIANKKLKADKGLDKFIACMIDIDHFKKINDTYGHDVGDIVLKKFSQEINNLIRHDDCFARVGGEEFILILSHIDIEIAKDVLERIMNKIRKIDFDGYPNLKITLSAGMSPYIKDMSIEDLLKNIDNLLYQAKNSGRNKYMI